MNNSMYFENYYVSEFQEGATCNTEFMSHSSLYPVVTSSWSGNMCQNENTTNDIFKFSMPAQLKANGYDCFYFHLGYRGFYNRGNFIPNFGFDKTNVYTTLELRMKCGVGKCGRCNVGAKYVCKDGPVFRCDELDELPDEY